MDAVDINGNLSVFRPEARISADTRLLGWDLTPEELRHIPEHWLTYPEPEASMHYLLGLLYIGYVLVGCIGNGLVIWIFSSAKSLRTPSNVFVLNLAVCDLMMTTKMPMFVYNSFYRGYATGVIGCQIYGFIGSLSGIGAAITNACIAYDRYNCIARPFDGRLSHTKAICMVICVWAYVLPWATLPLFETWSRFVPEGYLTSCTFDYLLDTFDNHLFVATIFTFSYLIPMSLIIYYYSQIVSHVVAHEKALKNQAKKMNVESLRSNQSQSSQSAEIRIAKAAITICFMFVASWTPYAVLALIGAFGNQALLTPGVTMIPACTCKLVACIDPYIYAISHPKYRVELQKRLPWLSIHEKDMSDVASNITEITRAAAPAEN